MISNTVGSAPFKFSGPSHAKLGTILSVFIIDKNANSAVKREVYKAHIPCFYAFSKHPTGSRRFAPTLSRSARLAFLLKYHIPLDFLIKSYAV